MTSKIKVDNIENQCGGAVVTKCGGTTTISGTTVTATNVKSNALQASDGGNLVSQSGTTITLGASGDTINLASGASQSGFGRTGTVDWQTGSIKTSTFTAANGEGYFCNTTGGAFTANLPSSPAAGSIVSFKDYAQTFQTNNLTVGRGGSNIEGIASDATIDGQGESVTFVYVDATKGWVLINESTSVYGQQFVTATVSGACNTLTTVDTNFKVAVFTGPGTFCVSNAGNSAGSNTVDYVVIGGGGAGGTGSVGGGGGAGGYRESSGAASGCYSIGIPANSGVSALPVTAQGYSIVIGGGGAGGSPGPEDNNGTGGNSGSVSTFSTITSAGGGRGASSNSGITRGPGEIGGSGGGNNSNITTILTGNSPPVSPAQGFPGGNAPAGSPTNIGGGGGGAGDSRAQPWVGDDGASTSITGSALIKATGGGGGKSHPTSIPSNSGPRGGGAGGNSSSSGNSGATGPTAGGNAGDNTGSGGGGGGRQGSVISMQGGNGGSGIIMIRYRFQ